MFDVVYLGGVVDGYAGRLPVAVTTTLVWVALIDGQVRPLPSYDDSHRLLDKASCWDVYTSINGLPPEPSRAQVYITARAEPLPVTSDVARLITTDLRRQIEREIQEAEGKHDPGDVLRAVLAGAGYPLGVLLDPPRTEDHHPGRNQGRPGW